MSIADHARAAPEDHGGAGHAEGSDAVPTRHEALMRRISGLRPARGGSFPLETVLLTVGGLCLPIGIVLILVGWYGAAHTGHLYEQIDYLISGGLLGLGLIVIGGFLYFAYWFTRQIRVTQSVGQQTQRALSRLEAQMAAMAASTAALVAATSNDNGSGHTAGDDEAEAGEKAALRNRTRTRSRTAVGARLVATERGRLVHRSDCPIVAGKQNLHPVEPDAPGYRACGVCAPFEDI
jgi:hypothetical protein